MPIYLLCCSLVILPVIRLSHGERSYHGQTLMVNRSIIAMQIRKRPGVIHGNFLDLSDKDGVVAAIVLGMNAAFEDSGNAFENGRAVDAFAELHIAEFVFELRGKVFRKFALR